jgi:cyclopropane-fatty-acyl-phospholipid synthase
MNVEHAAGGSPVVARPTSGFFDQWLAGRLQRALEPEGVRLELWDGTSAYACQRPAVGSLIVRDRGTLIGLALHPDLVFGEAYTADRLRIAGPLEPVLEAVSRAALQPSWRERLLLYLDVSNTMGRARRNIHHHYDLGNDFYKLWLDEQLVYTCAYFEEPDTSLEDAQRAKLDLVCRKLRLRAGELVVEAGCGWGALALHMARHYGVRVRAFNISKEQISFARERAAREGLGHLVEFIDDDYRNVSGRFDAFVSVGMLEHVGLKNFTALADVLRRSVRHDGGRGFLHFIGRDARRPLNAWIRRRIFPGAYPPTLAEVTELVLSRAGMSVLDVENLRLHYARTLAHWSRRFAACADHVSARFDDSFRRAWELYLAGSEATFAAGCLQLFQVVFAPVGAPPPHPTRWVLYRDGDSGK